ncbi:MAG: PEP/pyruvate-binding domain-containing protein, partial [Anaerotignaceae bacterium]
MAAFDRVFSGYETLDKVLDNIRLGDNVVWQVSSIEEYKKFALPFAKKAMADKKELIYIRFAAHPPILEPQDGLIIHQLDPEDGFENFTVQLHKIIEKANKDVFYIFDSLSELQVVWAADLMMGNFFQVTCPYLFELDTVAFFPILRGRHSFETVARIRETTQLLLDVYSADNVFYVHPHKVWNRYSATMFLPHEFNPETEEFSPITDGVSISRFYTLLEQENFKKQDQNLDSWERFFILCRLKQSVETLDKQTCDQLCRMLLTREKRMAELVEKYFSPMDYFAIRDRLIGTGTIGGKACGMLLAREILKKDATQFAQHYEPHDSYFIGSDVYYTYLVQNSCWKLRVLHRTEEGYFSTSNELKTRILNGKFSENLREQFKRILDHFGQTPIIVRSSSFLEDGFGNAFAGKYESVFCSNLGTPEERMEEFEKAIRIVYASTMDESALEYRRVRGLANMDEQMAILVQRVSGS